MKTFQDYLESVERNNPSMVGRKLTLHWDSLERLLESAYRQGREDGTEPIHGANSSMPDFMRGFFK
jgi:hypothetical protein